MLVAPARSICLNRLSAGQPIGHTGVMFKKEHGTPLSGIEPEACPYGKTHDRGRCYRYTTEDLLV